MSSTKTTIRDVNNAFMSIVEMYNDELLSKEDFAIALNELEQSKIEKCGNAISYLSMVKHGIEEMKAEEKRIATQRKSLETRVKNIENAFLYVLNNMGGGEVITKYGIMKIRKNPPSVVIDDISKIPDKYKNTKIEITPDKKAIKKAIDNNEKIEGCHIEQGEKLVY